MSQHFLVVFVGCILMLTCILHPASAEESESKNGKMLPAGTVITIGYLEFPPYNFTNIHGKLAGYTGEKLAETCESLQLKCKFISLPAPDLYKGLREGTIDLWNGVAEIPDIMGYVTYGPEQIFTVNLDLHYQHQNSAPNNFLEAVKDKTVITVEGYQYGGLLNLLQAPPTQADIIQASSHRDAFKMLEQRPLAFVLDYREPSFITLENLNLTHIKSIPVTSYRSRFIISLRAKQPQDILYSFHQAYIKRYQDTPTSELLDYIRQHYDEITP